MSTFKSENDLIARFEEARNEVDRASELNQAKILPIQKMTCVRARDISELIGEIESRKVQILEMVEKSLHADNQKLLDAARCNEKKCFKMLECAIKENPSFDKSQIYKAVAERDPKQMYGAFFEEDANKMKTMVENWLHNKSWDNDGVSTLCSSARSILLRLYPENNDKAYRPWTRRDLLDGACDLIAVSSAACVLYYIVNGRARALDDSLEKNDAAFIIRKLYAFYSQLYAIAMILASVNWDEEAVHLMISFSAALKVSSERQTEILEEFKTENNRMKKMTSVIRWCTIIGTVITAGNFIVNFILKSEVLKLL